MSMSIIEHLTTEVADRADDMADTLEATIAGVVITEISQPEHKIRLNVGALRALASQARGGRAHPVFTLDRALRLLALA